MGTFKDYSAKRLANTKANTWPFFTRKVIVIEMAGILGAAITSYLFGGKLFVTDQIYGYVFFTFAGILIANAVNFVHNWIMAPARMATEEALRYEALSQTYSALVAGQEPKIEFMDLGSVDKQDSKISWVLIQGSFGGSYRDPRFVERQRMGLS